jgi:hypothetical protein
MTAFENDLKKATRRLSGNVDSDKVVPLEEDEWGEYVEHS